MQTQIAKATKPQSKQMMAHHLHNAVITVKQGFSETKAGILKAGKALFQIKEFKWWKVSGSPVISFAHWCENELGISKSTAYAHIDAYGKVGDILENNPDFQSIEMSKVFLLLPYISEEMNIAQKEELLHMCLTTTWNGLRDNLKNLKGVKASDECQHEQTELLERCKICSKWLK